jgi:hypothetical protein
MVEPGTVVRVWSVNDRLFPDRNKKIYGVAVTDRVMPQSWETCAWVINPCCPLGKEHTNSHGIGWYFNANEYEVVTNQRIADRVLARFTAQKLLDG